MKAVLCEALIFFIAAVSLQRLWMSLMNRRSLGEEIKSYGPKSHMKKRGTPSMGGVAALISIPIIALSLHYINGYDGATLAKIWLYPAAAALIGLADDTLKRLSHSSEGFSSLQKLFVQIVVTLPWAWVMGSGGVWITPEISLGALLGVPILLFVGVGFMNAVNVTDGLDGLAAGATAISLLVFASISTTPAAHSSSIIALAVVLGFLWHNANPAQLFMGDVGAHLWAGLLLTLCIIERKAILIFPLGFIFGIEILTVSIQIFAIRRLKRKVFLMSPLHHHFELKGWSENKIVVRFCIVHILGMAVIFMLFTSLFGGGILDV